MDIKVDGDGILKENVTQDYGDYDYEVESELGADTAVWIPVLHLVMLVAGLLVNLLLLTVLFRKRRSWSITDIFFLHLCLADVLLLLTLPLLAAQAFQPCGWCFELGLIPCKISRALFNVSFYCGIFLLVCIVLDRYLFYCRSTRIYSKSRPGLAHGTCLCVWICSLVLVIPKWIFVVTLNDPSGEKMLCVENFSASSDVGHLASRVLHHTLGFLLPAAILIICCCCVTLRPQRGSKEPHKRRAFTVVLWLVVVFLLCWTPYNITLIVDTVKSRAEEMGHSLETPLKMTFLLGYIHTCLRPLLYLSLSAGFRAQTLALLRRAPPRPVGSLWGLGLGEDGQTEQSHKDEEQEQEQMMVRSSDAVDSVLTDAEGKVTA